MSLKSIIPIALGLLIAVLVFRFMQPKESSETPVAKAETVDVVVAAGQIARSMDITEDLVKIEKLPKALAPPNCYHALQEVIGKSPIDTIHKGWPVGTFHLVQGDHLVNVLKTGKRLVPLRADQVTAATHILKPGDHVDLLYMGARKTAGRGTERFSRILLQDVELLAVGLETSTEEGNDVNENAKRSAAKMVALALTPEEGAMVHLAEASGGKIRVVGRNKHDAVIEHGVLITERELWEDRPTRAPVADAVGSALGRIADAIRGVGAALRGAGRGIEGGLEALRIALAPPVAPAPQVAVAELPSRMRVRVVTPDATENVDFEKTGDGLWRSPERMADGETTFRQARPEPRK